MLTLTVVTYPSSLILDTLLLVEIHAKGTFDGKFAASCKCATFYENANVKRWKEIWS